VWVRGRDAFEGQGKEISGWIHLGIVDVELGLGLGSNGANIWGKQTEWHLAIQKYLICDFVGNCELFSPRLEVYLSINYKALKIADLISLASAVSEYLSISRISVYIWPKKKQKKISSNWRFNFRLGHWHLPTAVTPKKSSSSSKKNKPSTSTEAQIQS